MSGLDAFIIDNEDGSSDNFILLSVEVNAFR